MAGRPEAPFYASLKLAAQKMEQSLKDKNVPEFVSAYGSTLGACMGCHTALRKE